MMQASVAATPAPDAGQSPVKLPFEQFFEKNKGLIHRASRPVFNRMLAMGAAVEYQDVVQEATVVMMRTYERFDPSLGWQFSTYFMRAAFNELGRFLRSYERDRSVLGLISMHAAVPGSDEGPVDMEQAIDGHHTSPEQALELKQLISTLDEGLTPLAKFVLDLVLHPSEEFAREWAVRSQMIGAHSDAPWHFIGEFVQKVTGLPDNDVKMALREVKAIARKFNV